jgi:hypothetical protein
MTNTRREFIKGSLALSVMTVSSARAQAPKKRIALVHSAGWEEHTSLSNPLYQDFAAGLAQHQYYLGSTGNENYLYRAVRGHYKDQDNGDDIKSALDGATAHANIDLVIAAGGFVSAKGVSRANNGPKFLYIVGATPSANDLGNNAIGGVNLNSIVQNGARLLSLTNAASALPKDILLLQNYNSRNRRDEATNWATQLHGMVPDPSSKYFPLFQPGNQSSNPSAGNPDPDDPTTVMAALKYSLDHFSDLNAKGIVVSADPFFGRIGPLLVAALSALSVPVIYPLADYARFGASASNCIGPYLGGIGNPNGIPSAYWKLGDKAGTYLMTSPAPASVGMSTWTGSTWSEGS